MANVVIFGVGKGASIAYRYLLTDSEHTICGFTVEQEFLVEKSFYGLPVVDFASVENVFSPQDYYMFVPLGLQQMNVFRYNKYMAAKHKGYKFISYIHSSVKKYEFFSVGENCFILQNNSINFDVEIGDNVVIWSGNQIGDRSVIKSNNWISSHVCIAGDVIIEPFCVLGVNSTISNDVTIATKTFLGANALITKNTPKDSVYIVPSTPVSNITSEQLLAMINV